MCLLVVIVVSACAGHAVQLTEGMPNTAVVVSQTGTKEIVYDLRGDWTNREGTVTITQDGRVVEGVWKAYSGCCSCRVGNRWFNGTIEGSQVVGNRYLCLRSDTEPLTFYILEGGDAFYISARVPDRHELLEFKRMK
jgi:hypothetical protein